MALKFPKFEFIGKMNARSRLFLLIGALAAVAVIVYLIVRIFGGGEATPGSRVAGAPSSLVSVPGGQLTPEYTGAVLQANKQLVEGAKLTGASAVPTLINVTPQQGFPGQAAGTTGCTPCCNCAGGASADVANELNNLLPNSKLSQTDATNLMNMAKNRDPISSFAAALDELVRSGKLTPEQARLLLDAYAKQFANASAADSAKAMDDLIKSGELPIDIANELLELQKKNVSTNDYSNALNQHVQQGRLKQPVANRLLAQYSNQKAAQLTKAGVAELHQMAKASNLAPDTLASLTALQNKNASMAEYAAELQRLVAAGKLSPETAQKLLSQYQKQRNAGPAAEGLMQAMDDAAAKKQFAKVAELQKLLAMQGSNASVADYTNELKRAVQAGLLTAEEAAKLLRDYKASLAGAMTAPTTTAAATPEGENFAKLQAHVQAQESGTAVEVGEEGQEFAAVARQATAEEEQARQQRVAALTATMSGQAQSLITAWEPPTQQFTPGKAETTEEGAAPGTGQPSPERGGVVPVGRPIIKAGTILFAVLDTTADSDYADTPVMATIVDGRFKGAKLLGVMQLGTSIGGTEKLALRFNLMNRDEWNTGKTVNAFAIDPDTARTVMASSVDHHYLLRYGTLFATSFLSGYASAIANSGSTTVNGPFGSSTTTHPELNPAQKLAVGLGGVGQAFSTAVGSYVNTPPTVRVNAGSGLGILFMTDVPE